MTRGSALLELKKLLLKPHQDRLRLDDIYEMSEMGHFLTKHYEWTICDCCKGHGKVDHPAFQNGITSSEWQEMANDWDLNGETNAQQRYKAGVYDVPCKSCQGSGKLKQPLFRAMPREERKLYIRYLREQREEGDFYRELHQEIQAERFIGA